MSDYNEFVSIAILQLEVEGLKDDVAELRSDIKELVELWRAAGKAVVVVKWLASIVTALGICWAVIKHLRDG